MSNSKLPAFPKDWYKHCPESLTAQEWHERLASLEDFNPEDWANCAFINRGFGLGCEECGKHVPSDHPVYQRLRNFYDKLDAIDKEESVKKEQHEQREVKKEQP